MLCLPMNTSRQLWDISAPVHNNSPVYPGDTRFTQTWDLRLQDGHPVNLSTVRLSPHVGTHADAPLHYDAQGQAMGEVDLDAYLGPCRVIHALGCTPCIEWQHIAHAITPDLPPRVLVRTYAQKPEQWDEDFAGFAPSTIARLADCGVQLIGLDTPSVDPFHSHSLQSHLLVRERGLRILESLVLDDVPAGDYELIALPLKWTQAEASPVRAVLRTLTK